MQISHHIATEHAVYKSVTVFLGLCSVFALLVGGMNFGRYGYAPTLDFFWSPIALLLFWQLSASITHKHGLFVYKLTLGQWVLSEHVFKSVEWSSAGKIKHLIGFDGGRWTTTAISIEQSSNKHTLLNTFLGKEISNY